VEKREKRRMNDATLWVDFAKGQVEVLEAVQNSVGKTKKRYSACSSD
jgi:hypothetical protein